MEVDAIGRMRAKREALLGLVVRARAAGFEADFAHGWESHRYEFWPPLAEERVAAFERAVGVALPTEYRRFVTELADGVAGPGLGLFALGEAGEPASPEDQYRREPLVPAVTPLRAPSRLAAPFARSIEAGVIVLSHGGCANFDGLVLQGPERGHVWGFWEEREGPKRRRPDDPNSRLGLFDWYEEWLNRSLAEGARHVALAAAVAADRPRSRRSRTPRTRTVEVPAWRGDAGAYWRRLVARGDVPAGLFDGETRAVGVLCPRRCAASHARDLRSGPPTEACPRCADVGWVSAAVPGTPYDARLIAECLPAMLAADGLARQLIERLRPWGYDGRGVTWLPGRLARRGSSFSAAWSLLRRALRAGFEQPSEHRFLADAELLTGGARRDGRLGRSAALDLRLRWRHHAERGHRVDPPVLPEDPLGLAGTPRPSTLGVAFADLPDPTETLCQIIRAIAPSGPSAAARRRQTPIAARLRRRMPTKAARSSVAAPSARARSIHSPARSWCSR